MKLKIKRLLTGVIALAVGIAVLTGCVRENKEFQEDIDKINEGTAALLAASNISLSKEVLEELEEQEPQNFINEVVVNNITKEWYMKTFMKDVVKPNMALESLKAEGESYFRSSSESDKWRKNLLNNLKEPVGVSDISNIKLTAKDCKDIKTSSQGDNEVFTIIMSPSFFKKLKGRAVESMKAEIQEYKDNNSLHMDLIKSMEQNLEILERTKYISAEYTFTLNSSGVLVGEKASYAMEQPKLNIDQYGKTQIGEELSVMAMTFDIIINSYNDSNNAEVVSKFKGELEN